MGLDMYLYKCKKSRELPDDIYIRLALLHYSLEPEEQFPPSKVFDDEVYYEGGLESLLKLQGEWRKANHIHKWFRDNFYGSKDDNVMPVVIDPESLKELLAICEYLLTKQEEILAGNKEVPKEYLPREEGFFFGNNEYDEDYVSELYRTVKIIKNCLKGYQPNELLFYFASY